MYNQVIFYNHFGNGDIYESREFVKEWMRIVPANKYLYAHGKNLKILYDIDGLYFMEPTIHMEPMRGVFDDLNGNLYVNTWIGRDGKYVLPGIGCTVEKLFEMHNDMLGVYGLGKLGGSPVDYIPSIDYTKYDISGCDAFINETIGLERVFVDNGLVQSMQAENFEFNPIIEDIAKSRKDLIFIITHWFQTSCNNIISTNSITKQNGFDLNQVSYLSLFCKTLVGRNSGPHVFTQNKENCFDKTKKLVSFTHRPEGASFVVNTPVEIQKMWFRSDLSRHEITRILEEVV